jgi:hypothetical protein
LCAEQVDMTLRRARLPLSQSSLSISVSPVLAAYVRPRRYGLAGAFVVRS